MNLLPSCRAQLFGGLLDKRCAFPVFDEAWVDGDGEIHVRGEKS